MVLITFVLKPNLFHKSKEVFFNCFKIVISFGGVDPNNLTLLCLQSIYDFCVSKNIEIYVITGLGYQLHQTLSEFENIKIIKNTSQIFDLF